MFNYRLEAQLFEGALGVFRGGHVGIGAYLHVVEIVGGRTGNERGKFFLLDRVGHFESVALEFYGCHLQDNGVLVHCGRLEARGRLLGRGCDGLGGRRGRRVF